MQSELTKVMESCFEDDQEDRPADAAALANRMSEALGSSPTHPLPVPVSQPTQATAADDDSTQKTTSEVGPVADPRNRFIGGFDDFRFPDPDSASATDEQPPAPERRSRFVGDSVKGGKVYDAPGNLKGTFDEHANLIGPDGNVVRTEPAPPANQVQEQSDPPKQNPVAESGKDA